MMKGIRITYCSVCPYVSWEPTLEQKGQHQIMVIKYACRLVRNKEENPTSVDGAIFIPDWCPLPDWGT